MMGLEEADLALLATDAIEHTLCVGQILVQAGEVGDKLFVLSEGVLSAEGHGTTRMREAGRQLLWPGDIVGSRTVLLGEAHRQTITAMTGVIVFSIQLSSIQRLLAERPQSLHILAENLAGASSTSATIITQMRQMFPGSRA
jgi:CRP-like cAMP-binding protein